MRHVTRTVALSMAALLAVGLVACSSDTPDEEAQASGDWTPITIEHALGTTTIESQPERVATVAWANHEVPLALGVVPVGMAAANFGDDNDEVFRPYRIAKAEGCRFYFGSDAHHPQRLDEMKPLAEAIIDRLSDRKSVV